MISKCARKCTEHLTSIHNGPGFKSQLDIVAMKEGGGKMKPANMFLPLVEN